MTDDKEQIKLMPGFKIHWTCSRLLSCYQIIIRNGHKLINYCQHPHEFNYQFLPNEESRLRKKEQDSEALRFMHNFVASVKTLVDISRNSSNKYLTTKLKNDYQNSIEKNIKTSFSASFIFDLRNFILHRDLPVIVNSVDPLTGISTGLFIHTTKLLEWDNWSKKSLKKIVDIDRKDKKINVIEIT